VGSRLSAERQRKVAPVLIPHERAERASVGIAVPAAMPPASHDDGNKHRSPRPDPDTRAGSAGALRDDEGAHDAIMPPSAERPRPLLRPTPSSIAAPPPAAPV